MAVQQQEADPQGSAQAESRAEMRRLEREYAYSAARSDIECYCAAVGPDHVWHDTANVLDDDHETVDTAIRYLDLRGLIERSPQGWVRVLEDVSLC